MNQNELGKGSISNDPDGENKPNTASRWARLRQFVLSRPKGNEVAYSEYDPTTESNTSLVRRAPIFRRKQKLLMESDKNETEDAPKSMRSLRKTKTFRSMFGRGKGKLSEDCIVGELEDDFVATHPHCHPNGSSIGNSHIRSEEGNLNSTSKTAGIRYLRESNANRTMIFKADLPPCSPLSTEQLTSGETEKYNVSRKSDESETESMRLKRNISKGENSAKSDRTQRITTSDGQDSPTTRKARTISLKETFHNVRLGSIAFDDGFVTSRLQSSPLASPRAMHKRTSSLPKHIGHPVFWSTSAPEERHDEKKKGVSNDYESPWGVKNTGDADSEGERHSSKGFRVTEFVNGLKGRKMAHSSSSRSWSLTDEEGRDTRDTGQAVDMIEDEFVKYSVKQQLKSNGRKSIRSKKWK